MHTLTETGNTWIDIRAAYTLTAKGITRTNNKVKKVTHGQTYSVIF